LQREDHAEPRLVKAHDIQQGLGGPVVEVRSPSGKTADPRAAIARGQALFNSSDLTLIECDRVLVRAVVLGEIDEAAAADRRADLNVAAARWHAWRLSADIVDRARRPFPNEPIRTLDAMHLASALAVRSLIPGVELLSLDERIRRSGEQLGFRLKPASLLCPLPARPWTAMSVSLSSSVPP
jgi:predicted nucleic acid-binding protein